MPRPAYIICSRTGALDQYTNSVSCFNIIEALNVSKMETEKVESKDEGSPEGKSAVTLPIRVQSFGMRVLAVWIKEESDSSKDEFEAQIVFRLENTPIDLMIVGFPNFHFEKRMHRLVAPEVPVPPVPDLGLLLVECRVRRVGATEWLSRQSYPIILEEGEPPAPLPLRPMSELPPSMLPSPTPPAGPAPSQD